MVCVATGQINIKAIWFDVKMSGMEINTKSVDTSAENALSEDHVDEILTEWSIERPDLDVSAQGIVGRVLRLSRYFERDLAATFMECGLNGGQLDVLATLRRCGGASGLSASQLANKCMLSTASMTNRLDRLESMQLIERTWELRDRRVTRIALTSKGQALINDAFPAHVENQDRMVALLSREERELLSALLRRLLLTYEFAPAIKTESGGTEGDYR